MSGQVVPKSSDAGCSHGVGAGCVEAEKPFGASDCLKSGSPVSQRLEAPEELSGGRGEDSRSSCEARESLSVSVSQTGGTNPRTGLFKYPFDQPKAGQLSNHERLWCWYEQETPCLTSLFPGFRWHCWIISSWRTHDLE